MGKAAVILVAAVTMASTVAYMSQDRQAVETLRQEALYEHQVLAREIATSAFNRIESRVRRDFENHRTNLSDVAHRQGEMDISAVGSAGSDVTISATGRFEGAEYTITGVLSRSGSRVLDALTVDAAVDNVSVGTNARLSGIDTNPDGTDGSNEDVHAVLATSADAFTAFSTGLVEGLGIGLGGLLDVEQATPELNLQSLSSQIQNYSGSALVTHSGNTTISDETIGSAQNPVVMRVAGNLSLSGNTTGYGVLFVDGDFSMHGPSRWEGLVFVENDGGSHSMTGQARVYGAVVVRSIAQDGSGDDGGLPGGHFDVDVFDSFGSGEYRYHEHKYDDDFDVTGIDLLNPDRCKNGGLCWDAILGTNEAVYVSFKNETFGYGTYDIQAGAGTVQSTCDGGDGGLADFAFQAPASVQGLFGQSGATDICHQGTTMSVGFLSAIGHLLHGDSLGACPSEPQEVGSEPCVESNLTVAAVNLQGATHEGLSSVLLDARQATSFEVDFQYLCALQISSPNGVIYDPTNRNDVFTIQIHAAEPNGSSFQQGDLLYETSVYHHTGYGWWDDPGGVVCDPQLGGGDELAAGAPIDWQMTGSAMVQYSSAALTMVQSLIPDVNPGTGSIRLGSVRESGERPTERPRWLGQ